MAPPYLARDLRWTDQAEALQRRRSGSRQRLIMPRTRLRTIERLFIHNDGGTGVGQSST